MVTKTTKKWYLSKTLWINFIAILVIIAQANFGFIIGPEYQVGLLGIINLIVRSVTGQPIGKS